MTPEAALRARVLLVAAVAYAWLITRRSLDPFGTEEFGLTFNSMLDHLLQGRWDVDPAAIGYEAFLRDGRTYAYFGPVPALLRLPLLLVPSAMLPDWRSLHVERLSCWVAIMTGIAAQTSAVMTALAAAPAEMRKQLAPPLVVVCAVSGPPMLLSWRGALIYHETILWAWALAMVFVALARPGGVARQAGWRRLCALSGCAGLCVLTRVTTGAGLLLAAASLILLGLWRQRAAGWRPALRRPAVWAPAAILAAFAVVIGGVNQGRWGHSLTFADLRLQTILHDDYPDRLARLHRHALFAWERIDIGLLYYLAPIWTDGLDRMAPLGARLSDLYDAIEPPASSLLLTDPAWCLLAALSIVAIARRRVTAEAVILVAAAALAPVLMVMAWYLAFRYRVEFAPLLIVLACVGLSDRVPRLTPLALGRTKVALSVLCVLQIAGSMLAGWTDARASAGTAPGYAAFSLHCAVAPAACIVPPAPR